MKPPVSSFETAAPFMTWRDDVVWVIVGLIVWTIFGPYGYYLLPALMPFSDAPVKTLELEP